MSIQSLGVGSGLDLESLVTQLLRAERTPKEARLNTRESVADATISGFGKLKSKMSDLQDSLEDLKSASDINSRNATVKGASDEDDDTVLTASARNAALTGTYDITVNQLAQGTRLETANASAGGFGSPDDVVLSSGTAELEFGLGGDSDTFTVTVTAGMTLSELREAINSASDNFGVSANLIDTGTADGGTKLVFMSDKTGTGNDLFIRNVNDNAELNRVATTSSDASTTYLTPIQEATNAQAVVDGITVESATNTFENTIVGVDFTVEQTSEFASDGVTRVPTELQIGIDKDAMQEKIDGFIKQYNALVDEIDALTAYGGDEGEDGALAGDSLARSIRSGLSAIVGSGVADNEFGGLFAIGIELTNEGKLEIGSSDFGLGTGQDRLDEAMETQFSEVAALFGTETTGIAAQLFSFVEQYTDSDGLIANRETAAKAEQDLVADDRERLAQRMESYEQLLRDRYLNLDQTVTRLNQTGTALLASLGQS
jgi:flagellar hook-associated protein 2